MRSLQVALSEKIPGSKYFTWGEALWLPSVEGYAAPDSAQQSNISRLAKELDRVREHFGRPMNVHSWLRPERYNQLIGGAKASLHRVGLAVDFSLIGLASSEVQKVLSTNKNLWAYRGELGTVTWTHLDLGTGEWFYPRDLRQ